MGPFPKAKGGFEYIRTYVDMTTTWREAILPRKATTAIVVSRLTEIFTHNGFPGVIITDNAIQFVSKSFESFGKVKVINMLRLLVHHRVTR